MRRHIDRAGAEEECDLREGVVGNVNQAALDAGRCQQRDTKDDVGKLADGRIGQPRFQVVLAQRHGGGNQNGDRDKVGCWQAEIEGAHRVHAEDIEHDANGGEYADLHDRDARAAARSPASARPLRSAASCATA